MTQTLIPRLPSWRDANAECKRAALAWDALREQVLPALFPQLSPKEQCHLRHTVFRINALLFLYARLRRTVHDTEFGVLLGAITHLLDYVYDHREPEDGDLRSIEDVVFLRRAPNPTDMLSVVLATLSARMWPLSAQPVELRRRLEDMLRTQRRSLMQTVEARLDPHTLSLLTRDKGHHSLCLYFAAVNPGFDGREALALASFGNYMQYMDDLEDLYEDRAEGRQSLVPGVARGILRSTRLLHEAWPDLAGYYARSMTYDYRGVGGWLVVFHVGVLFACLVRELTRRLPRPIQLSMDRWHERLVHHIPLLNVTPLSWTQSIPTGTSARSGRLVSRDP